VPSLGYTSILLWILGYPEQAMQRQQAMLALAQELAQPYSLTLAAFFASWLHQLCRAAEATQAHAETAMALATEHGFPLFLAMGRKCRAWALVAQGQVEQGIHEALQGLEAYRRTGAAAARTHNLALLAEAYGQVGQVAAGLQALDEALAAVDQGEQFYTAEVYRLRGELLLQSRVLDTEAAACFQHALTVARQQQAKAFELRAAVSLSRLWQRQGQTEQAHRLLAETYGWFPEGLQTVDLQEARALLENLAPAPSLCPR
jgi:predicted ATPase